MVNRKHFWQTNSIIWKYVAALLMGLIVGFKALPIAGTAVIYMVLCLVCLYRAFQGNMMGFLIIFPYAIYTEIFIRGFARWVPYLTLQYLLIAAFSIFLIKGIRNTKSHFKGYVFLSLYMLLELLNNLHPDKPDIGRAIMTNTLALLLVVFWASVNVLNPITINRLLTNIKVAAIFLTGIVFVAHLQGKINYGAVSNSDASNGMAPVQLSGYLGTGCVLFFLSIMNEEEAKTRWLNILLLAFSATVMLLTFSRGGLYFVASTVGLFFYYNRHKMGSYFRFLFLIPVAFVIYNVVVEQTGGKIVERYNQEGSSNRDVLINVGFELFLRNMVTGVGTGNYNTRIVTEKLFSVESGAHNEFVRSAAEHGIIGITLYWGFFVALFFNIRRRRQPQQQFAMFFFALFCLITVHNGLKISLQPIVILLAIAIADPAYIKRKKRALVEELPQRAIA